MKEPLFESKVYNSRRDGYSKSHSSTYEEVTGHLHRVWLSNSSQCLSTHLGIDQSKWGGKGIDLSQMSTFFQECPHTNNCTVLPMRLSWAWRRNFRVYHSRGRTSPYTSQMWRRSWYISRPDVSCIRNVDVLKCLDPAQLQTVRPVFGQWITQWQ